MVEVGRVGGRERLLLAAVETRRELDGWVAAGPEVQLGLAGAQLAELLGSSGGGVALVLCCGGDSVSLNVLAGMLGWEYDATYLEYHSRRR